MLRSRVLLVAVVASVLLGLARVRAEPVDLLPGSTAAVAEADADGFLREATMLRIREHLFFVPSFILGEAPRRLLLPRAPVPGASAYDGLVAVGDAADPSDPRGGVSPKVDVYQGLVASEILVDHMAPRDAGPPAPPPPGSKSGVQKDMGLVASGNSDFLSKLFMRSPADYTFEDVALLFVGCFCLAFFVIVYMSPFLVGRARRVPGSDLLLVLNILAGWTVIGWVMCLFWAMHRVEPGAPGVGHARRA